MNALVRDRWARVARLGVNPDSDAYPALTSDADLLDRREHLGDVFREERRLIAPISEELATGPRVAILADPDGVILFSRGDPKLVDPVARVRLVEGARWDEETRGTNAIGTAVAEGCAVAVIGQAHYEARNKDLFCYASPVHDAYGDLVAVLDVSGPLRSHDPALGSAVVGAATALERALRALAYGDHRSGALAAIERLVRRAASPAMLVEASGDVPLINAAARRALPLPSDRRVRCEDVFGLPFAELACAVAGRGGTRFETSAGAWRIDVDPIAGGGGRTLALLVLLEPDRPAPALRAARPAPATAFDGILALDPRVQRAKELAARFAKTRLPVLLLAETGTGKELFARAIHEESDVAGHPFVAVNCGALSPSLIASELFGYAPGAFTGAARSGAEGRISAANGGTLFLDEIAEMPEPLQAALLRVLDDGVYQRVGEAKERRASFRLICATCRDLPAMVAEGRFRSDLFYRIHGAAVTIPTLRDRSDAVWLAERFVEQLATAPPPRLSPDAARFVATHDWPGNVRELKSAVLHALALSAGEESIGPEHWPEVLITRRSSQPPVEPKTRKDIVRGAIESALHAAAGNVSEAARKLGVGRGTIYRALREREIK